MNLAVMRAVIRDADSHIEDTNEDAVWLESALYHDVSISVIKVES